MLTQKQVFATVIDKILAAGRDQDRIDFSRIMAATGNISLLSECVLQDVIDAAQAELDGRPAPLEESLEQMAQQETHFLDQQERDHDSRTRL